MKVGEKGRKRRRDVGRRQELKEGRGGEDIWERGREEEGGEVLDRVREGKGWLKPGKLEGMG